MRAIVFCKRYSEADDKMKWLFNSLRVFKGVYIKGRYKIEVYDWEVEFLVLSENNIDDYRGFRTDVAVGLDEDSDEYKELMYRSKHIGKKINTLKELRDYLGYYVLRVHNNTVPHLLGIDE